MSFFGIKTDKFNHLIKSQIQEIDKRLDLELNKVFSFNDETIYGLSGLGDLICTCYSHHSRNRKLGILLSKGKDLNKSKNEVGMVSEGIYTSKVLFKT